MPERGKHVRVHAPKWKEVIHREAGLRGWGGSQGWGGGWVLGDVRGSSQAQNGQKTIKTIQIACQEQRFRFDCLALLQSTVKPGFV